MNTSTYSADTGRHRAADYAGGESRYLAVVAPNGVRKFAVLEVLIGMVAAFGLAYMLHPSDPLLMSSPYPWLWLLATVFALRYGALLGVLAGLCIMAAWWLLYGPAQHPTPTLLFAGGMMQLVVVGHCSDLWIGRFRRLDGANDYLDDRLSALITSHHLLRVSHEHMEREMLGRPATLRDAVTQLREAAHANAGAHDIPNPQQLLEYVANVCRVDQAAIYRVTDVDIEPTSLASVGSDFVLVSDDPLLLACLESGELTHLRSLDSASSAYIACVPIFAGRRGLSAVLVVRGMPFLALNTDNLQLLRTLTNYYVDGLSQTDLVEGIHQRVPACPDEFALELGRVARIANEAGIPSTLMAFEFPLNALFESAVDVLLNERRTLDVIWTHASEHALIVFVLLPLTDTLEAHGYRLRIQRQCQVKLGLDLDDSDVRIDAVAVPAEAPGLALCRLLYHGHHD